jgi:hypothetical protein
MPRSTPIPLERRTTFRQPLVSASVEAGFLSPAEDYLERSIEVGEDQELTIWGAVTFIIHQAK